MLKKRITQLEHPQEMIDLGSGNPDPGLFPLEMLQKAAERYFSAGAPATLQYGAEAGNGYFLAALADFLSVAYQSCVDPRSLFTTTGASTALDLLCTLFTRAGDVIFVEEPSYFLALRIFADHGLQVVSIPMDENGLQVDRVEDLLTRCQPKFLYIIPTFHNPTSLTLSQARREILVRLAQRHNFLIIADEVYHFLPFDQKSPQSFAMYSKDIEQVISIQSFSKILAPGLRLGWIQAHDQVIKKLVKCGLLDSGGGMNPFTSAIVRYLIEDGDLNRNLIPLRRTYAARRVALLSALDQYLPQAEYNLPQGGFFTWIRLPEMDTSVLRPQVKRVNVDFRPGVLFSSQNGMREYMRLGFSYYSPEVIERGVMRLGKYIRGQTDFP